MARPGSLALLTLLYAGPAASERPGLEIDEVEGQLFMRELGKGSGALLMSRDPMDRRWRASACCRGPALFQALEL